MDNKELWKPIEQFLYIEASSKGRIKRLPHGKIKGKILTSFAKDKDGYNRCSVLKLDGTWTSQPVHRLIALAFIDNPENKPYVNHIDSNRTNNNVNNLEWVTPKENVHHSIKHGKRKLYTVVPKNNLLTEYQISQINNLRTLYTVNQIAKLFNINYQSLKNIIHRKKKYERLDNQQPSISSN